MSNFCRTSCCVNDTKTVSRVTSYKTWPRWVSCLSMTGRSPSSPAAPHPPRHLVAATGCPTTDRSTKLAWIYDFQLPTTTPFINLVATATAVPASAIVIWRRTIWTFSVVSRQRSGKDRTTVLLYRRWQTIQVRATLSATIRTTCCDWPRLHWPVTVSADWCGHRRRSSRSFNINRPDRVLINVMFRLIAWNVTALPRYKFPVLGIRYPVHPNCD